MYSNLPELADGRPTMQPLRLEDFDDALKNDDAFFLYLQNFDTEIADLVRCMSELVTLR